MKYFKEGSFLEKPDELNMEFSFLEIRGGHAFARTLHMLSAYWGFVLMTFHWNMIMGMTKKRIKGTSQIRKWMFGGIATLIAGYGIYAFSYRQIGKYMLMINHFVFFDFEEPLIFFIEDYMAVMGLFVWVGYSLSEVVKKIRILCNK